MPNKLVTFNDRDPPWMNGFIKNGNTKYTKLIKKNGHTYSDYPSFKKQLVLFLN